MEDLKVKNAIIHTIDATSATSAINTTDTHTYTVGPITNPTFTGTLTDATLNPLLTNAIMYPVEDPFKFHEDPPSLIIEDRSNITLIDMPYVEYYLPLYVVPTEITDVKEIVPNLVTEVEFNDGEKVKVVLDKFDNFDIEYALFYAIAKKFYKQLKKECVSSDLSVIVKYLMLQKKYCDIVDEGERIWEEYKRRKRRAYKRKLQKERRDARRLEEEQRKKDSEREEAIKIQEEAFLRAFKQIKANEIAETMKAE